MGYLLIFALKALFSYKEQLSMLRCRYYMLTCLINWFNTFCQQTVISQEDSSKVQLRLHSTKAKITCYPTESVTSCEKNLQTRHFYNSLALKTNPIKIWVNKSNAVITCNDIAKCRQTLFHSLYFHFVRQRVADMLQFLIGCCVWYKQTMLITWYKHEITEITCKKT